MTGRTHEELLRVTGLTLGPVGGGPPVLQEAHLTLGAGRTLGMVGRSGSGKSSLALSLLGHVRAGLERRSGTVTVAGADPFDRHGARRLRGRVVSYVGQDPAASLNPMLKVGSHITDAVRRRSPGTTAEIRARVGELLSLVRLPADRDFLRRRPHQISGGQAQRVALAAALAGSPRLLVLDEPTGSLDGVLALHLRELIADVLRDGDCAAVLVSHDLDWVGALADEVVRLDAGRITAAGPPAEVLKPSPRAAPVRVAPDNGPARSGGLLVRGLTAAHRRKPALRDVSLTVPAGTCTAVVGPSGAGKTTLARCVVGLQRPVGGTVTWEEPRDRSSDEAGRAAPVQLVAQDSHGALNPRETVRTALLRPCIGQRGMPAAEAQAEARRILGLVGLSPDFLSRRPGALSGGERQRVNLGRALAAAPRMLVCDEVTSALDPEIAEDIVDLLNTLCRKLGLSVLLISHDLTAVARCADHVVVLDAGTVVESGAASRVLGQPEHRVTRELVASRTVDPRAVTN